MKQFNNNWNSCHYVYYIFCTDLRSGSPFYCTLTLLWLVCARLAFSTQDVWLVKLSATFSSWKVKKLNIYSSDYLFISWKKFSVKWLHGKYLTVLRLNYFKMLIETSVVQPVKEIAQCFIIHKGITKLVIIPSQMTWLVRNLSSLLSAHCVKITRHTWLEAVKLTRDSRDVHLLVRDQLCVIKCALQ